MANAGKTVRGGRAAITMTWRTKPSMRKVMGTGDSTDPGAFPSYDPDEDVEFDFAEELSRHLVEGSVTVIVKAGAEKLRYVHGHAVAVDSAGAKVSIEPGEIYELAAKTLGGDVTRAEY